MAAASFNQTSFLGGVWSQRMQGRVDDPRYRRALNVARNCLPTEEGALPRRPGMEYVNTTRSGVAGRLIPFHGEANTSYAMEFTNGHVRVLNGIDGVVFNAAPISVTSISTATPAVATVTPAQTWATGDQIEFFIGVAADAAKYPSDYNVLKLRKFTITRLTSTTFSLADAITNASIVGAAVNTPAPTVTLVASRVLDVATPWSAGAWANLRSVQNQDFAVLLHPDTPPYTFTLDATLVTGSATLEASNLIDGPYKDADLSGAFLSPVYPDLSQPNIVDFYINFPAWDADFAYGIDQVALGSNTTCYVSLVDNNLGHDPVSDAGVHWAATDRAQINDISGFTSADLGRCVRVKSEPLEWAIATTYDTDDTVLYNGEYYVSVKDANLGTQPDTDVTAWLVTTSLSAASWTWGKIIAVASSNPYFRLQILGAALLYGSETPYEAIISQFRFGLYGGGGGEGYPTCGVYHQGRLWLGGAVPNRFDASNSNQFFDFTPTGPDGTIADNNSIAAVLNSAKKYTVLWMESISKGILVGTLDGEWLIHASALNDPISPTSIQAHEVTSYGCLNAIPVKTGLSIAFIQKHGRKILEMLPGNAPDQYSAPNIATAARHLTKSGVAELAYHEEPVPVIWARKNDGTISGITYRRTSPFASEDPNFAAWFEVDLGGDLVAESICTMARMSAVDDISSETLATVVYSASTGLRYVTLMTPLGEEDATIYDAWFLDNARAPYGMLVTTSGGASGMRAYGLWHLEGKVVDCFIGGLDCGTATVGSGSVFVAFGSDADAAFTLANMQGLSALNLDYGKATATFSAGAGATAYTIPAIFGQTYTTVGQTLRPGTAEETGARNGPPLAKTRRAHIYAAHFLNTVTGTLRIGTRSNTLRPVVFKSPGGSAYTKKDLFSGVFQNTLEDDYSFNSMLYWEISRPYPATLLQIGAFLHTQDQ